jgi:hypothetical protein
MGKSPDETCPALLHALQQCLPVLGVERLLPPACVASRETLQLCGPTFASFGYTLIISPEAVRRAVTIVRSRDSGAGVRAVTGLLRRVADRMLIRAVSQALPVGGRVTLAPDDVES